MTDKEFEKELDKMYDAIDQKQYKMEELGLINYGDSGYYWRNPEEYEKDSKICELESEVMRLEHLLNEKERTIQALHNLRYTYIKKLKNEILIIEKALELTC